MKEYGAILRPKNLLIVGLSQLLIYFFLFYPVFKSHQIVAVLDPVLLSLFIIVTMLIAGAGYVINDIFDYKADLINKPEKTYISPDKISINRAWIYYFTIVFVGFIISGYIAFTIQKPGLWIIYPVAVLLLYFYSSTFKKSPLIGNLIVAIFCAFVPGILVYAEYDAILALSTVDIISYQVIVYLFVAYISFGFFATLARELVKDLEDVKGDEAAGYNTLPIVIGEQRSKVLLFIPLALLLLSGWYWYKLFTHTFGNIYSLLIVCCTFALPVVYIIYQTMEANDKSGYAHVSRLIKWLMIVYLLLFLLLPKLLLNI